MIFSFSALQRAENSSMRKKNRRARSHRPFQCSSASRKFLNFKELIQTNEETAFQCSSASRKFLNTVSNLARWGACWCFSALQRAENSSIFSYAGLRSVGFDGFSALQRAENSSMVRTRRKPPRYAVFQCSSASRKFLNEQRQQRRIAGQMFQCSSASRKFLNAGMGDDAAPHFRFQCSSASRKFLNAPVMPARMQVCVAFQCSSASRKFLNSETVR